MLVLLGLAACGSGVTPGSVEEDNAVDVGISAFKDVCLASAPSFANAAELAKRYSAQDWMDLGEAKVSMTKDRSLSVQIKPNKECAITTQMRPGEIVHVQFMNAVIAATNSPAITVQTPNPFVAILGGRKYTFTHNRSGGEAYVMAPKR